MLGAGGASAPGWPGGGTGNSGAGTVRGALPQGRSAHQTSGRRRRPPGAGALVLAALLLILLGGAEAGPTRRQAVRAPDHQTEAALEFLPEVEKGIFRLTNQVRRQEGLPTLTWDPALARAARRHSADMLLRGYFQHESPEGRTPRERLSAAAPYELTVTGENLWGTRSSQPLDPERLPRIIVESWLASPGHRANLLNPAFTDLGVGVARQGTTLRATQVFGAPRAR